MCDFSSPSLCSASQGCYYILCHCKWWCHSLCYWKRGYLFAHWISVQEDCFQVSALLQKHVAVCPCQWYLCGVALFEGQQIDKPSICLLACIAHYSTGTSSPVIQQYWRRSRHFAAIWVLMKNKPAGKKSLCALMKKTLFPASLAPICFRQKRCEPRRLHSAIFIY